MISIITTVYNVEEYLTECLTSILKQTFNDFELIIVNDCSTDNSLKIINEFRDKDKRIKLINNENNIGCGMSRYLALKEAKGDYISFIDGDDYIDETFLEKLYEAVIKNNADISCCFTKYLFNESGIEEISKFNLDEKFSIYETDEEKVNLLVR